MPSLGPGNFLGREQMHARKPFAKLVRGLTDMQREVMLAIAPSFAFLLVKRRDRKTLEPLLQMPSIGDLRWAQGRQRGDDYERLIELLEGGAGLSEKEITARAQASRVGWGYLLGGAADDGGGVDLLTFACGQRGVMHRIVRACVSSGSFLAYSESADSQQRSERRREALAAAMSVRNRKTVEVLLEAWPELSAQAGPELQAAAARGRRVEKLEAAE